MEENVGIVIEPICDVAITPVETGFTIHFSRMPDVDIVRDLASLRKNPGIFIYARDPDDLLFCKKGPILEPSLAYWVTAPPTYSFMDVLEKISEHLSEYHNLAVELIQPTSDLLLSEGEEGETADVIQSE